MKKKLIASILAGVLALGALTGCGSSQTAQDTSEAASTTEDASTNEDAETASTDGDTITVTDNADHQVTLPKEINRIVVADIYPMASILTLYLGSAEKLVGIHPVCMSAAQNGLLGELFPEILNADTSFMTGDNLNVEELLNLKPDVVFCSAGNEEMYNTLTNAGIAAVAISPGKWNYDVIETYNQWTSLLGQMFPESDKSKEVAEYSQTTYDMIQEKVSGLSEEEKKNVLFLFQYDDTQMITSGKNFFGQYWCDAIGATNAATEVQADNANAKISMEQVYEWNPDVIFVTNFTQTQPDDLYNNAIGGDDWSSVAAVQNQEVYKLPLGSYRSYTPSADTPLTLEWMAKQVYPDLFEDIDMNQEVKDYYQKIYGVELTDEQVAKMYAPTSEAATGFTK